MKKIIVLSFLFIFKMSPLWAQNSYIFPTNENDFNIGKELFEQGKYAASFRYFENFLQASKKKSGGKQQEAEYYIAIASYHLKSDDAYKRLTEYIKRHPYSPFINQVYFSLGKIALEEKDYKSALDYLTEVDEDRLNRHERTEKTFLEGYALLQTGNYQSAANLFKAITMMDTRYNLSAKYYYAYSEYMLNNFNVAEPLFLELEELPDYENIVAYYLIQIDYANENYKKVNLRAKKLLEKDPKNPNNAEIYRILGEIAYKEQDYKKAITLLNRYEKGSQKVLRNDIYLLGMSYFFQRDYQKAIEYLSSVTTKSDELSENAYLHIGNAYVQLKDKTNAKMAYEAALSTHFDNSVREEALYNYALTAYDSNDVFGESFSAFERLLEEFPNSRHTDSAYNYLSSIYMTSQNFSKAYESIKKMRHKNKRMTETKQYLLNQLGAESFVRNDYEEAVDYFTLALNEAPNRKYRAESLYWRAESYYRLGLYEETIQDLNAFFSLQESNSSPNEKMANYLMGHAYFSTKSYGEALRFFKQYTWSDLSPKDPTYAESFNRMGDCYYYQRDFHNAEASYAKAIRVSPKTGEYPLFQLAYIKGLQKKNSEKIKLLEELISYSPNSQYTAEALYEIGRANLATENEDGAIEAYQRLLAKFPNNKIAPKAALEIGLIYLNKNQTEKAIQALKKVIAEHPGSEEAQTALESLESIYIEQNRVGEYVNYAKSLGGAAQKEIINKEDSILFITAEKLFFNKKYTQAVGAFNEYLERFEDKKNFSPLARYYLAESYYNLNDKQNALSEYEKLVKMPGKRYREEAVMRIAEISFDNKEYDKSGRYFKELYDIATTKEQKDIARLGILRSEYILKNNQKTIDIAKEIIADSNEELKEEALFKRGKSYLALGEEELAISDFEALKNSTKTASGAESQFVLADLYFKQGKMDEAERVVLEFAKRNTPYQYWLARSFVLLADIYIKRNNDFQAKQYLLSLQKNYTEKNDVQAMIKTRLEEISSREENKIID